MDDRKRYLCCGGPWRGEYLWLQTRSTLLLCIGGKLGRYVADNANKCLDWQTN